MRSIKKVYVVIKRTDDGGWILSDIQKIFEDKSEAKNYKESLDQLAYDKCDDNIYHVIEEHDFIEAV